MIYNVRTLNRIKPTIQYKFREGYNISFALHDKKFCSLARNKRGFSVGLAWVVKNGTRGYIIVARNVLLARA